MATNPFLQNNRDKCSQSESTRVLWSHSEPWTFSTHLVPIGRSVFCCLTAFVPPPTVISWLNKQLNEKQLSITPPKTLENPSGLTTGLRVGAVLIRTGSRCLHAACLPLPLLLKPWCPFETRTYCSRHSFMHRQSNLVVLWCFLMSLLLTSGRHNWATGRRGFFLFTGLQHSPLSSTYDSVSLFCLNILGHRDTDMCTDSNSSHSITAARY